MTFLKKIDNLHKRTKRNVPIYNYNYKEILQYYGYILTDYEAYGLGTGIGIEYVRTYNYNLASDIKLTNPRLMGFFSKDRRRLAKNLRIWLDVYRGKNPDKAIESLKSFVALGNPVIVEVNITEYSNFLKKQNVNKGVCDFDFTYNFSNDLYWYSYMLIVIGFDDENKQLICLDANLDEHVMIPYADFLIMNSHSDNRFDPQYEWTLIIVPKHKEVIDPKIAIFDSIKLDIYEMENPYQFDDNYVLGIGALRAFREDVLSNKINDSDLYSMLIGAYNSSEVLYENTGFFRKTYSKYLENAMKYFPTLLDAKNEYVLLSNLWQHFFNEIKRMDEKSIDRELIISLIKEIENKENYALATLKKAIEL